MIGNEVHIQRGETFSLDFAVRNPKGHPFVVLNRWSNPYLAITVTAALYEQQGDFRETYWLDLANRYVEQADGSMALEPLKTFTSAEALFLPNRFSLGDVMGYYSQQNHGNLVLDKTSDFDVTKFLFYTDPKHDGNYVYKYIKDYKLGTNNAINEELVDWVEYDFRVIKQFNTKSWMEQGYLYDIKVLAGESVQEHLANILMTQRDSHKPVDEWTTEDWETYIALVQDEAEREEIRQLYDDGIPLMSSYDTKSLLLEPTPIYVSVNIQGGVK
jgi:hypothetical protein